MWDFFLITLFAVRKVGQHVCNTKQCMLSAVRGSSTGPAAAEASPWSWQGSSLCQGKSDFTCRSIFISDSWDCCQLKSCWYSCAASKCRVSLYFRSWNCCVSRWTFSSPAWFRPNQIKTCLNLIKIPLFFSANQITHMLMHVYKMYTHAPSGIIMTALRSSTAAVISVVDGGIIAKIQFFNLRKTWWWQKRKVTGNFFPLFLTPLFNIAQQQQSTCQHDGANKERERPVLWCDVIPQRKLVRRFWIIYFLQHPQLFNSRWNSLQH